ncbi:MAG: LysR family transcriptional regulator, partial [Nitrospirota bacterium]|nr:LysR family transcriptional regulator [Nitrospirota bacterium]
MNLTQLQFVQAIAETGSFSRAAERCFVTQPTLSNAVAHLEDELGGRLFSRTTRKVGLTPLGEHLLPFIRSALGAIDDLLQSAKLYKSP